MCTSQPNLNIKIQSVADWTRRQKTIEDEPLLSLSLTSQFLFRRAPTPLTLHTLRLSPNCLQTSTGVSPATWLDQMGILGAKMGILEAKMDTCQGAWALICQGVQIPTYPPATPHPANSNYRQRCQHSMWQTLAMLPSKGWPSTQILMFFWKKGGVIFDPKNYIADFVGFKTVYFGRKFWKNAQVNVYLRKKRNEISKNKGGGQARG